MAIEGWKTATSVSQCFSEVGSVQHCDFQVNGTNIAPYIQRSVAKVEWGAGGPANIYRVGHKGKVMSSQVVQCMHDLIARGIAYMILALQFSLGYDVDGSLLHFICKWWILLCRTPSYFRSVHCLEFEV